MIPDTVSFTELEVDPSTIVRPRRVTGNVPRGWTRYAFDSLEITMHDLDQLIETTVKGRWHSYSYDKALTTHYVIHFENASDAMLFRLKGGEQNCKRALF